jgi:hypothetical protein
MQPVKRDRSRLKTFFLHELKQAENVLQPPRSSYFTIIS